MPKAVKGGELLRRQMPAEGSLFEGSFGGKGSRGSLSTGLANR